MNRKSHFFEPASLLRMAADAALIQAATIIALVVRYLGIYVFQNKPGTDLQQRASDYISIWSTKSFYLTVLCLIALGVAGVYTRRRFYLGRFKALAVFQAISVAFLIYGAAGYFVNRGVKPDPQRVQDFPVFAFLIAFGLSVAFLIGARTFIRVWQRYGVEQPDVTKVNVLREEADKRVLVVGGAGYIGSALVPQLLEDGYRVRVLDAMLFGEEPLQACKDNPNLEITRADFRTGVLRTAMKNVGSVVHLAGIVGDPACNLDEGLTIDVNLTSTRHIADTAKWMGVRRFVFASTCSVYGACDELLDEKSVAKPVSLYGNTKLASETVLQDMASPGFSPTILRFATIYGLSGRTRFDLVVNLLSAKAKMEGKITVFNGSQWRPFVHVVDAAQGIRRALGAPIETVHNEIFNVGSSTQNHTILEIGELIHQQVIGAKLLVDNSGSDARNYRVDFTKIKDYLGFEPQWTIKAGIEQVLAAIADGKVQDYRDPKYSNYAFLNEQGTSALARDYWALEMIRDMEGSP